MSIEQPLHAFYQPCWAQSRIDSEQRKNFYGITFNPEDSFICSTWNLTSHTIKKFHLQTFLLQMTTLYFTISLIADTRSKLSRPTIKGERLVCVFIISIILTYWSNYTEVKQRLINLSADTRCSTCATDSIVKSSFLLNVLGYVIYTICLCIFSAVFTRNSLVTEALIRHGPCSVGDHTVLPATQTL